MKKTIFALLLSIFAPAAVLAAIPHVDQDTVLFTQSRSRRATISYILTDAPAIVTLDIQTNSAGTWVSIGAENFISITGAVNRVVSPSESRQTIHWDARADWPDHAFPASDIRAVVTAWSLSSPPDYLVVDLHDGSRSFYTEEAAIPGGVTNDIYKLDKLAMRKIPAAGVTWWMGSPYYLSGFGNEDLHWVTFTNDYYMGVYEFTQGQWSNAFLNANCADIGGAAARGHYRGADRFLHPVESIDWRTLRDCTVSLTWPDDGHQVGAQSFFGHMRAFVGNSLQFDLPTEAQWEYAAKAGEPPETKYVGGSEAEDCYSHAWMATNSAGTTHIVGLKLKNNWGLYDVIGNVSEWCLDYYIVDRLKGWTVDPPGAAVMGTGSEEMDVKTGVAKRCDRGGSFTFTLPQSCVSNRYRMTETSPHETIGFRICCPATINE
ncbi:MAG: formylglycine-generating enzyme family protein [Kiritimatiellae bacterium]|nr:formylglycine-generating enzyme family protein [Kiritimatiellia bacterium]